jgi:hypothetical protein
VGKVPVRLFVKVSYFEGWGHFDGAVNVYGLIFMVRKG